MFKGKKKIAGMICLILVLSFVPTASVATESNMVQEGGIITPYWTGVTNVYSDLICSGGKANPMIDVTVDPSKVDKVNFNGSLLQYKSNQWTTIASWNVDKPVSLGHSLFNQSYGISSGYDYKFVTTVKAYKGSTLIDTISVVSAVERY